MSKELDLEYYRLASIKINKLKGIKK